MPGPRTARTDPPRRTRRRPWWRRPGAAALVLSLLAGPLLAVVAAPSASASMSEAFTRQFSANTNGDVLLVGNTLMTCPDSSGCTTARAGTGGPLNNNDHAMRHVDVDGDPSTFASSSADLVLPTQGTVLFAALAWSARTTAGAGGTAPPTPSAIGTVKLRTPGASGYTSLADPSPASGDAGAYQGFVDVTDLVRAAGSGTYTVADVQAATGNDRYAGWSLVVAVADPTAPARNLTVYKGFGSVSTSAGTSLDIPVSGFLTPEQGAVTTTLGTVVYEGDRGFSGDRLQVRREGATDFVDVSDAQNPVDNVFNSTISARGSLATPPRSPRYANQLGLDIDTFSADGLLGNDDTSATLRLTTTYETFYPGVVTFVTDLYEPQLEGSKTVEDVDGGLVERGDVLRYTVPVSNTGLDAAIRSRVVDAVPTGTTFVPGSIRVGAGSSFSDLVYTAATDADGDDLGRYRTGEHGGVVEAFVGEGATPAEGGRVPTASGAGPGERTHWALSFDVTVDGTVADGARLLNIAQLTFRGGSTGTASSVSSNDVVAAVDGTAPGGVPATAPDVVSLRPSTANPSVVVPVLANDEPGLELVGVTDVGSGTVGWSAGGSTVTYTPAPGFAGRDSFTYTVRNASGATATEVVHVDVVNELPVAADDAASTHWRSSVLLDVLANDTDPNGDALTLLSVAAPSR
ncbi:Ig-like domain-containing protein, partial [Pseudokineococcus sp. 1T1Z-3]|uniref:Ig-like domain-containing protein n=1 Tax=Pseudokineococcus sp. 1T1Z-3 TaxID=3132745 RepID=UPI003094D8F5